MTIHDPSLRAALKTLKVTGMLDTLDARLAQTRDGKLGHLEFLQVLCEDEIARRDTAALARRVRRARFEQHATFEDFDFTVSPKLPAAMLRDRVCQEFGVTDCVGFTFGLRTGVRRR